MTHDNQIHELREVIRGLYLRLNEKDRLIQSMAERIAAQSELLAKRAHRGHAETTKPSHVVVQPW